MKIYRQYSNKCHVKHRGPIYRHGIFHYYAVGGGGGDIAVLLLLLLLSLLLLLLVAASESCGTIYIAESHPSFGSPKIYRYQNTYLDL